MKAEDLLAKSDNPPINLYQHSIDAAKIAIELKSALPALSKVVKREDFFFLLFLAAFFHDWGKAHKEFQKVLKDQPNKWEYQRHEIFSIPFIPILDLPQTDINLLERVVLAHHKHFEKLAKFLVREKDKDYFEHDLKYNFLENFQKNVFTKSHFPYFRLLKEKLILYQKEYFPHKHLKTKKIFIEQCQNPLEKHVRNFAKEHKQWSYQYLLFNTIFLGALKLCDHLASAGVTKIYRLKQSDFKKIQKLQPFKHQRHSWNTTGNAILVAPTGSGKTEAALGWVAQQLLYNQARIYYLLPYTASINSMFIRLSEKLSDSKSLEKAKKVGVLHGNLAHFISNLIEKQSQANTAAKTKKQRIYIIKNLMKQIILPLKVATPFQVLKHFYGVKRFEIGLAELSGGIFIFDEIHAYDTETFARIIVMLEWLQNYGKARIFIMTATLPTFMMEILRNTLKIEKGDIITPSKNFLKGFTRHRVFINQGDIFQQTQQISDFLKQQKRILIVCNTVKNAQALAKEFQEKGIVQFQASLSEKQDSSSKQNKDYQKRALLLHSRFCARDRNKIEEQLEDDKSGEGIDLLIGTQAIEVSLDIDYDILFSEPAPLDALIQRMGRVNRKKEKGICPVYICKKGGENDSYIYPPSLVTKTLQTLGKISVLHEEDQQASLDEVYPFWEKEEETKYEQTKTLFNNALKNLVPFLEHKENEESFYEQFTNIKVLPAPLFTEYAKKIKNLDWIGAQELLVSLHQGLYFKLKNRGQLEYRAFSYQKSEEEYDIINIPVALCKYDSQTGMQEEEAALDDTDDAFS